MDRSYRSIGLFLVMLIPLWTMGCSRTFRGNVVQPNPLVAPNDTLRDSEEILIVTGDMELNLPTITRSWDGGEIHQSKRYPLHNAASFTVVSRDRLRFHVQIEHKWLEWADLSTWEAHLVDDTGRRYQPEALERVQPRHVVQMWDYETRTAIRDRFGDIVYVVRDGHRRRAPLGSLSVFRGKGDFVFYSRDIFTPRIKRLTLILERPTTAFAFTWSFADESSGDRVVPTIRRIDLASVPAASRQL
ncbi:MAG: hypothetical protein MJE77_29160 [Proteobacteria bacterium]|nr:hypothetical protein [Pseudomonadota bacterium]